MTMTPHGRAADLSRLLQPLAMFYAPDDLPLPVGREIDGRDMPEPQQSLLVHDDDMTPTLERFIGGRVHLSVRHVQLVSGTLAREVVLLSPQGEPLEYGAIRIHLERFDDEPRRLIREGEIPLGRILEMFEIPHTNEPTGFFEIASDIRIAQALGLRSPARLYGRHNTLFNRGHEPMAQVVEILPPFGPTSMESVS
jgi:chorismate-pyruvate lyase